MKKHQVKSLSLKKNVISNLQKGTINGGGFTARTNNTCDASCLITECKGKGGLCDPILTINCNPTEVCNTDIDTICFCNE